MSSGLISSARVLFARHTLRNPPSTALSAIHVHLNFPSRCVLSCHHSTRPSVNFIRFLSSSPQTPSVLSRLQRIASTALSKLQPPPTTDKGTPEPKLKISRLVQLAQKERSLLGIALAAQLISASSIMVFPLALGNIVDAVTGTLPTNLDSLVALMGTVFVVSGVATATRVSTMSLAGSRISRSLRVNLYNAILRQDTAFFDVRQSGELINRLSNDVPVVSRTLTEHLAKIIRSGVTATSSLALIVYLSPKLSLVTLCSIPPIGLFATIFGRNARHLSRRLVDALAAATQVAAERTSAIRTVRTFGAESVESRRYAKRVDDTYGLARRVAFADGVYAGSVQLAAQMSLLGVLWFGGRMVLDASDAMTIGALTSFSMYAVNLGVSVAGIGTAYGQLTRALGSGFRIFEVLDRKPEGASSTLCDEDAVADSPFTKIDSKDRKARRRATPRGRMLEEGYDATVQFDNVRFSYPTRAEAEVLSGVDLTIRPGEIVAVAGMSGSGKSTLSALLSRMYEPTEGQIILGGVPVSKLDTRWLRQQVAVVAQEPTLFSGTVEDNIRYALSSDAADEVRVRRAARDAASDDMIDSLVNGFDTTVGERGATLSGGQRARIALCRALVRDPRVLILDEHSAALDAESERAVARAVCTAAEELNMTVLTIAHRASSLRRAHRVAVLVDGRVAEMDSYDALMGDEESFLRRMLAPPSPSGGRNRTRDRAGDGEENTKTEALRI